MKVRVITVGKAANAPIQELVDVYEKRLARWTNIRWTNIPSKKSPIDESFSIIKQIKYDDYVVLLDEAGRQCDTPQLANKIEQWMRSYKKIVFVIGGSYGVDEAVKKRADYTWSFSRLVFPHQIMKILLVEQLYRAMDLGHGGKYHHE